MRRILGPLLILVLVVVGGGRLCGEELKPEAPSAEPACAKADPLAWLEAAPRAATPARFASTLTECPYAESPSCFYYAAGDCLPCGPGKRGYCDNYMCSDGLLHSCCYCGALVC